MDNEMNLENQQDDSLAEALAKLGIKDDELDVSGSDDLDNGDVADKTETKKELSKEEKAILALKKEQKELKKLLKTYQEKEQQEEVKAKKSNLVDTYKSKGYDDDTAGLYAENEIKLKSLEEKMAVADFREENYEVLSQYPQARSELKWLMNAVEKTGLTAEQICKGKYGEAIPAHERRAKDAMNGLIDDSIEDDKSTVATRTATQPGNQTMTASDKRNFNVLKGFNPDLTVKEYFELKKSNNL